MKRIALSGHRCVTQQCVDHIKHYTGFHATPHLGPEKIWTIGYAHTRTVRANMVITPDMADVLLDEDLKLYERLVNRVVRVPLNDDQFSALVDFAISIGSFCGFEESQLVRLLNRGWYDQTPAQLLRNNRINGEIKGQLSRRRQAAAVMWNRGNVTKGLQHAKIGVVG